MVGPDVLKFNGDFTQFCQLPRVSGGGAVTHCAKQLEVKFLRVCAHIVKESVFLEIDSAETANRLQVGRLGERTLVPTDQRCRRGLPGVSRLPAVGSRRKINRHDASSKSARQGALQATQATQATQA